MADVNSTVIIDIDIRQQDATTRARELSNRIIELKDNQDKLRQSGQQLGLQYRENAQQIRTLEREVQAYLSLARNQDGSINSLRAQISLLTNQYNALSRAERENTSAGRALTRQLEELRIEERAATQAAGDFRTSIGTYEEAIRNATQNMLPFGSEISRTFAAVNSLSGAFRGAANSTEAFKLALLSTGIGAAFVAVATLITYLQDLDFVTDKVQQTTSGFKAGVGELGRALLNLQGPIQAVTNAITAYQEAAALTSLTQDLEDKALLQSVKTAQTQAEIAEKRVQAMNRALDPAERQKLLKQADELDSQDLAARQKNVTEKIRLAELSIGLTGNLNKKEREQLKKGGVEYALELQNNRIREGKITEAQTKQLADAYTERIQIQNEYTQRSEKRFNLSERIAMQQQAAEQKRADEIGKINEDRERSELYTSQSILTIRQKELADINNDINKRIEMYQKYGQSTVQLEIERQARLKELSRKFLKEDSSVIIQNIREAQMTNVKSGNDAFGTGTIQQQAAALQSIFNLQDIDKQIQEVKDRMTAGEAGLEELLQSFVNKRRAIELASQSQEEQDRITFEQRKTQQLSDAAAYEIQLQQDILNNEQDAKEKRIQMNNELIDSFSGLSGTIAQLAGKNSATAKIAFGIEQSLAIAKIIMNAEIEKSAIARAAAERAAIASVIPVLGIAIAAAEASIASARIAEITAKEIISVGTIAALAIGTLAGYSQGGYVSGPGTGKSDSIPARLSNGESVMTAEATKMFYPVLSAMNVAGGGRAFANGGVAGTYVPDISQGIKSRNAISDAISGSIRGVKNVVYVESIIDAVDKQEALVENANF